MNTSPTHRRAIRPGRALQVGLLGLACALPACGNSDPVQTPTATAPSTTTEVYAGTLSPRGSTFYSFQVSSSANANITLASLTNPATGRALDAILTLGLGVPAAEDCSVSSSTLAAPGLAPQLTTSVSPGIYCVRLSDPGNLAVPVSFGVRIHHP